MSHTYDGQTSSFTNQYQTSWLLDIQQMTLKLGTSTTLWLWLEFTLSVSTIQLSRIVVSNNLANRIMWPNLSHDKNLSIYSNLLITWSANNEMTNQRAEANWYRVRRNYISIGCLNICRLFFVCKKRSMVLILNIIFLQNFLNYILVLQNKIPSRVCRLPEHDKFKN